MIGIGLLCLKILLFKKLNKKNLNKLFSSIFKSFKNPASGKENAQFPDSPDFENFPDYQAGRDVR